MLGQVNKVDLIQEQRKMLELKKIRMAPHKNQDDEMDQWDS